MEMATFTIVLVEPKYEGNIGSVARVMKNFGFRDLLLINPPEISREAKSMAMHAQDVLENAEVLGGFDEVEGRFDFLIATSAIIATDRNPMRTPVFPEDLRNSIGSDGGIALIFGREDYGLFNDEIERCDLLVTIPTSSGYPTMNLAQAVCVILYELSKLQKEEDLQELNKLRSVGYTEKKVLLEKFDNLVDNVHEQEFDRRIAKKTFRQLIGRAFISTRESFTLTGLFRRASEKIEKSKNRK